MFKAECLACGRIAYQSRKWLDGGAPLCPCNGEPLHDCRAGDGSDPFSAYGPPSVRPLEDRYVRIQKPRYCGDCQRFHDVGAAMQKSTGTVEGVFVSDWYCVDCTRPIEYDPIPWKPEGSRIHA